jgi:adenylate cyclase
MERRLAAIMATDVVGYSRLIRADEEGTLAALKALRADIIDPKIAERHGRIVKLMGDGMLVEFASVVDAVHAAVQTQQAVSGYNAEVPKDKRIELRIGINLGDVVIDGDDIQGDGINVASRLEGLAEPEGICISGAVYDQVRDRTTFTFEDMGEQQVKNIDRPVRVWRWLTNRDVNVSNTATPEKPPALPDKPSIAVLAFDNMSGDIDQEYFSDGIAEDLTTALSHIDWLFVIARNSAFTYKGEAVDVKRVGRELGVRYVLEGSVRRAGNRVRINAQLIDTGSGRHIWAERFDRQMEDVFELQDDIVARIAATLGPEITLAEIERARGKRPGTLDAWDHYLRAITAYHKLTKDDVTEAISLLNKAIKVDPGFANAFALLGLCHLHNGMYGWVRPARQAFEKARRIAKDAVLLAPSSPETNQALAFVLLCTGDAEQAVTAARLAIDLNSNFAEAYATLGHALIFCGDLEEGLATCQRAARNNPRDTRGSWLYNAMGHAYFMLGDYEQAIDVSKKGLYQDPSRFGAMLTLAGSYACLGREAEAKCSIDELLRLIPRYSLRALSKNPMFVRPEHIDKLVESVRLAGLPE